MEGQPGTSRCTTRRTSRPPPPIQLPLHCEARLPISPEFNNPGGVPISAIIFGGPPRPPAPLVQGGATNNTAVFVSNHGVGDHRGSRGAVGVVRRPDGVARFTGYNMGDYFRHWLDMGKVITNKPAIFNVNWFRTDDEGKFIWPGFGENMRVVLWVLSRAAGEVGADETVIGYLPKPSDINIEGLDDVTIDTVRELLSVDVDAWKEDCASIREFFDFIGSHVPKELYDELDKLEANPDK